MITNYALDWERIRNEAVSLGLTDAKVVRGRLRRELVYTVFGEERRMLLSHWKMGKRPPFARAFKYVIKAREMGFEDAALVRDNTKSLTAFAVQYTHNGKVRTVSTSSWDKLVHTGAKEPGGYGWYTQRAFDEGIVDKNKKATLYSMVLSGNGETFFKIGITARSVERRAKTIPYALVRFNSWKMSLYDAFLAEKALHKSMRHRRYTPRINFDGMTECFRVVA